MRVRLDTFIRLGAVIQGRASETMVDRDFATFFGVTPTVCFKMWQLLRIPKCTGILPVHLLWALMFFKIYGREAVLCSLAKTSTKTYRKWIWKVIPRMAGTYPLLIKWENRYIGDKGRTCLAAVDGTDYSILEPTLPAWKDPPRGKDGRRLTFNPKWYTHKFNGPGVRYETATNIQTGDIVWTNGPFPCGRWPDAVIFNHQLRHMLDDDEMVEADGTYRGMPYEVRMPHNYVSGADKWAKKHALARHETIHRRLKQFGILGQTFRHDLYLHKVVFQSCAALTQLAIRNGEMNWNIYY